jgi:uncharacterized membrane protein
VGVVGAGVGVGVGTSVGTGVGTGVVGAVVGTLVGAGVAGAGVCDAAFAFITCFLDPASRISSTLHR